MDFVLNYDTMNITFTNLQDTSNYQLEATVKNKKTPWKVWSIGDKGVKWKPIYTKSKWSVPLLKSNLQKAVRQMNIKEAKRSVLELALLDTIALLRRLPIIAVEDVTLIQGTAVIIWMMMINRDYLYKKEITFILNYVVALCKVEQVFVIEELKETDIKMNNDEVKALAIRIAYGGMPGDMEMLKSAIQVFNRDPIIDMMEKNEEVPDVVQFNSPILMSAIDFHPTPWIVKYIARKSKQTEEMVKSLIWNGESAYNNRKPETIRMSAEVKDSDGWWLILAHLIVARKLVISSSEKQFKADFH